MNENFIYKLESNPDYFWFEKNQICLREYQKDLIFYWSGEKQEAEYALYDKTPVLEKAPTICSNGKFGSFSKIKSPISFNPKNLESLTDNLSLSCWIGTNVRNGYYTYYLKPNENFSFIPGDYSLNIQVDKEYSKSLNFKNNSNGSFSSLKNKLSFELDPSFGIEVDLEQTTDEILAIKSCTPNASFTLSNGTDGIDLLSILDIDRISFGTIPSQDIDLISLSGETCNFKITHVNSNSSSKLRFTFSSGETTKTTTIDWNNDGYNFDNIEVDIDSSVMYVFLNGELKKAVLISPIVKNREPLTLTINGTEQDYYSIEELIVKSKLQHKETFIPQDFQLTRYNSKIPYIDFHFNGKNIIQNYFDKLVLNCSDGISCVLNYDGFYYYYAAGAWRYSDGNFKQSNDSYTFSSYLNDFAFDGKSDLFIRCFFESNGVENQYISDIYFSLNNSNILDGENTPAIIVGKPTFQEDQEIDLNGKDLIVKTDQGTTEINFDKNYTIDDLIRYLNSLFPMGIFKIYKDELGRIVLISETKGDNAFISLSGDAANILFGNNTSNQGKNPEKDDLEKSYDKFIQDVKDYSCNDLIPIEIDDDQIRMYLKEALNIYKKYRSDDYNTYHAHLVGSPEEGYKLPAIIEDHHDIKEILFKPLFPIGFYTGSNFGNADDILSLALINSLNMGGTNRMFGKGFATDYYISLMSISNFEQTTGISPTWKILNNRLFIFPNSVTKYLDVQIVYKAPIDPIKAMRDPYIMKYVYGKIRCAQAEIRGQYGSTLSSGSLQVQFNASEMYERGKAAIDEALEGMKKEQEPLGFFFG